MLAQAVAQHQVELRQHQRRRAAALVGPVQLGIAHDELVLLQEPVARPRVAAADAAVPVQPGDMPAARRCRAAPRAGRRRSAPARSAASAPAATARASAVCTRSRCSASRPSRSNRRRSRSSKAGTQPLDCTWIEPIVSFRPMASLASVSMRPTPFVDVRQNHPVQRQPRGEEHAPQQQHAGRGHAGCRAQPLPAARQGGIQTQETRVRPFGVRALARRTRCREAWVCGVRSSVRRPAPRSCASQSSTPPRRCSMGSASIHDAAAAGRAGAGGAQPLRAAHPPPLCRRAAAAAAGLPRRAPR